MSLRIRGYDVSEEKKPVGKVQKLIVDILKNIDGEISLTDICRNPSFRGVDFGRIMDSATALVKNGIISKKKDDSLGGSRDILLYIK